MCDKMLLIIWTDRNPLQYIIFLTIFMYVLLQQWAPLEQSYLKTSELRSRFDKSEVIFWLVLCHKVYYTVGIKKIWGGDLLVIQLTKNGSIQHNIKILTNHIIDEWTLKTFITWSPIFGSSHFRLMICYCICMYSLHTPAENKDESQRERGGEDED